MGRFLVGIDEAGRGPLAGPVAVGVVAAPPGFDMRELSGVRDSKQMSELGREIWFEKLQVLEREAGLRWSVQFSSALYIDTYGIVPAIKRALARGLRALEVQPDQSKVLLDGSLKAPKKFLYQQTIIRGDATEPIISLASVAAKVKRDRLMRRLALKYPEYGFEVHKGYGTKKHRNLIRILGTCDIHRQTFCKPALPVGRVEKTK
ncbi:MAG TPA: ribonuclease HII [Candidatus Paceibacterota bacterium]|nr:ribonuclease HII [Candidatus Paceibacterota bacterium]